MRILLLLLLVVLVGTTTPASACKFATQGTGAGTGAVGLQQQGGHHRELAEEEAAWITGNSTTTTTSNNATSSNTTTTTTTTTSNCTIDATSPVHGLEAELRMISRQTRGLVTVINNCQLVITKLEVALDSSIGEDAIELVWYSALSLIDDDVAHQNKTLLAKTSSTPYVVNDLIGNSTFHLDTLHSLDQVGAILLYERPTKNTTSTTESLILLGQVLIQKLKPGPAADLLVAQPTYFDNCLSLSPTARLRWTVVTEGDGEEEDDSGEGFLEVGLEYIVPFGDATNTWMAFGPGSPGVQDRLMGGSDVIIGGFRAAETEAEAEVEVEEEEGDAMAMAFAEDYYIGGYEVCTDVSTTDPTNNLTYDGVCRDLIWTSSDDNDETDNEVDNVELLYSHILEGVALVRYRRPLQASTPIFDHDIVPGSKQHYVWARGPLDPTQGMAEVQFHGYQFGQLKDMDLNATTWECGPLQGVELGGSQLISPDDLADDEFTLSFDHQAILQGDVVEVFWTLLPETSQIRIGARAFKGPSKWMSIAIGSSMTDAYAWVATTDTTDDPQLLAYRMNGLDASTVRLLEDDSSMLGSYAENPPVVTDEGGLLSFEVVAKWPLPGMKEGETAAPIIWAVGPSWRGPTENTSPRRQDEHSLRSKAPTTIDFATGGTTVGSQPSNSMLLAHAALMWIAWLIVAPLTGIASRYVRDDPCLADTGSPSWIQLHKNGAAAVSLLSLIGLILCCVAVADAGLLHIASSHAKLGIALLCVVAVQNSLGLLRPSPGPDMKRRLWELSHRLFALTMLALAVAAVITGSKRLEDFDSRIRHGIELSVAWIVAVSVLYAVYELRKRKLAKSTATTTTADPDNKLDDEEEAAKNEEIAMVVKSSWISTYWLVYTIPFILGIMMLIIITVIGFTGSISLENQMSETSISASVESSQQSATAITPSTDAPIVAADADTSSPTDGLPTASEPDAGEGADAAAAPVATTTSPVFSTNTAALDELVEADCDAFPLNHLGDGWCDDHEPFNTAECGWDGGDCCNIDAGLYNCKDPTSPNFGKSSPKGWAAPLTIPRNPRYSVSREETAESWVISYNNYYEFGFSKDIVDEANRHADFLAADSWYIDISGLVEHPMTLDVTSLIDQMQLEERMYRHRCVEAWSITAPWIGFPLSKILDMVRPLPEAAIVQFVSWKDFTVSETQEISQGTYPWPYTEALRMDEARNELTMLTVGAFGKPLTPQQGAPIRLNVPWKYGFKSIKSIEQINFLEDDVSSRQTFWSVANGREYGFYANVNPEVPHARWSQATERHYVEGYPGVRLDTTRMNGYQELVDYLYGDDLGNREIYF